ncbi:branched-chain amino acid ABC transporter permease [Paraburkholderia sp. CNPSo 3281]|uniref:branched-chain amino acid ABC transporter permease n=1 Tax=Paraburkholderia sp. CNPSo 3281 TaxID=2940933 RepID=UPI0020B7413A|nr:branched-chain amino acid ABC transporter permease [Paraburkholderia sp. CNPSo 3281]MCP3719974.1 branched-chain amino acid ABC transporter permease [Paraburkholderia sp. CNPSo 3281]
MNKKIGYSIALIALLAAPVVIYPVLLMKLLCFVLFACAFNLLIGFTGLLSFGHAALFGGAGYVTGYVLRDMGYPFEIGVIAGTLGAAVLGFAMGTLAIRRKGIYFTMITLALAQMLYYYCLQARFTGGEDGMQDVPRGWLLGMFDLANDMTMYYVVLVITVAGYVAVLRIVQSPFGHVLRAIKENEPRAISLGYDVDRYKLLAFVLSAALAGLAGATKTVVLGFETLGDVHWTMSGLVILMTLVGGLGTLTGPVVGALVIILLENRLSDLGDWLANLTQIEWFRDLGESVTIVTGLIFIVCVLLFRKGIVGELASRSHLRRKRRAANSPQAMLDAAGESS